MPNVKQAPHKAEAWIEDHKKLVYGAAAVGGLILGYMWYQSNSGGSSSSAGGTSPSPGSTGTPSSPAAGLETIKIEILKHTTTGKTPPGQLHKAFGRGMIFGEIKTVTQRRNFLLSEQQNALKHHNWSWLARIQAALRGNAKQLNPLRREVGWGKVRPTAGVKAHPANTVHKKAGGGGKTKAT
jgi:hypothetical protein